MTEEDADVIPVVTLTVDAIWAVDVDAETAADSPAEIIPAAISFGSSFSFAFAVTMDLAEVIAVDVMTTAGSLSFSSACAAMAADVTTAAADRLPFFPPRAEVNPSAFGDGNPVCHSQIQYLFQLLPSCAHIPDLFHKRNSPPLSVFLSDPSFSLPLSFCL